MSLLDLDPKNPRKKGHHADIVYYAVDSVLNDKRSIRDVAAELGVSRNTVHLWTKDARNGTLDLGDYLSRWPEGDYNPAFFNGEWGTPNETFDVSDFDTDEWYAKHGEE